MIQEAVRKPYKSNVDIVVDDDDDDHDGDFDDDDDDYDDDDEGNKRCTPKFAFKCMQASFRFSNF
jgi:phosphopantothenoylcysteine synthetase/decarboxylase